MDTDSTINFSNSDGPPADLTPDAAALWHRIVSELALDSASMVVVAELCRAVDRAAAARAILAKDGLIVRSHGAVKAHPCISIETAASACIARCYKLLGLDDEPSGPMGRPPGGQKMLGGE